MFLPAPKSDSEVSSSIPDSPARSDATDWRLVSDGEHESHLSSDADDAQHLEEEEEVGEEMAYYRTLQAYNIR